MIQPNPKFRPEEEEDQDELIEKIEEKASTIDEVGEKATEGLSKASETIAQHYPLLEKVLVVAEALPPIKLAIQAATGLWQTLNAIFLDKKSSTFTRASKVLLAGAFVGIGIAMIAAPVATAALLIASAGVALIRDAINFGHTYRDFDLTRKEAEFYRNKTDARSKAKMAGLEARLTNQKIQLGKRGAGLALGAASLVGFVLLPTPLAPFGVGIIIGTAVAGVAMELGPPLFKKAVAGFKLLAAKIKSKFSGVDKDLENKNKLEEREHEGEGVKMKMGNTDGTSTTELVSDIHHHDLKETKESLVKEVEEHKHALEEEHVVQSQPKTTSSSEVKSPQQKSASTTNPTENNLNLNDQEKINP